MKRERGIELLNAVLTSAAQAEERPLTLLDAIHVFGSFARGALEPHDVDVDIELTLDDEFASDIVWSLSRGQDPYAPVRHALIGRRRGVQFRFNELAMLHDAEIATTLLWQRGQALETALARLNAITPDPSAGRAPRDAMLPVFEGIDRHVPRPVREMLAAWSGAGAISLQRIELPDAESGDAHARAVIERRWGETSVLRRAGHAALAYLEHRGVSAANVHLHGHDLVTDADTPYFIGFQWRYADLVHRCLTHWGGMQWIEIPHPTRSGPLSAVRIDVADRDALAGQQATW